MALRVAEAEYVVTVLQTGYFQFIPFHHYQ